MVAIKLKICDLPIISSELPPNSTIWPSSYFTWHYPYAFIFTGKSILNIQLNEEVICLLSYLYLEHLHHNKCIRCH